MQQNFATLNKRFESLESNLEKKFTDKMNKAIDKRISSETDKAKKDLDKRLFDMRQEFENDIEDMNEKLQNLSDQLESIQSRSVRKKLYKT